MKNPMFSVIVPVYNVAPYLERCVYSLLKQNRENYEILLIDDGSTDESGNLCDVYAKQFEQIKVFHKKNGGLSSARNYGIEKATGEIIIFVDSDDYVDERMYDVLQNALKEFPRGQIVAFGGIEKHGNCEKTMRKKRTIQNMLYGNRDYLLNAYRNRNMNVEAWLYAYKKDFLNTEKLRFKEGILHEDVEFMPRVLLKASWIIDVPDNLYYYIVRDGSISTSENKEKNIKDLFETLEEQATLAETLDTELKKWMKNAVLDSYLNMIQEAHMYKKKYRVYMKKKFLWGKAATNWNHLRVLLCTLNVKLYCIINDFYKSTKELTEK